MKELLNSIWENLNNIEGKNEEYFAAILKIVDNFGDFKFTFDYKKANIDKWLRSFDAISQNNPDETILLNLANIVANLLYNIANAEDIEYTTKFLNELTKLYNKYKMTHQFAFSGLMATALANSVNAFGRVGRIDEMLLCMANLKSLSETYKNILPLMVGSIHNAILGCKNSGRMNELEPYIRYLKSVSNQLPAHVKPLADDIINEFYSSEAAKS
jgi:hypothetical protein